MAPPRPDKLLRGVSKLQALARTGLAYCKGPFCRQRYEEIGRIAADLAAEASGLDLEAVESLFTCESGYVTPKVDVRAAVIRGGEILMVREASDGRWTLPGGWSDVNESPRECVEREVFEETGYRAKALKLAAFFDKLKHDHPPRWPHAYKAFFLCEIVGGAPATSVETTEIGFFPEDALPELSVHRVTAGQIRRCFEHSRRPEIPTDFD